MSEISDQQGVAYMTDGAKQISLSASPLPLFPLWDATTNHSDCGFDNIALSVVYQ